MKKAWAVKRIYKDGHVTLTMHPRTSRRMAKILAHDALWESPIRRTSCVEIEYAEVREVFNSRDSILKILKQPKTRS
jgi:hypothetical protein